MQTCQRSRLPPLYCICGWCGCAGLCSCVISTVMSSLLEETEFETGYLADAMDLIDLRHQEWGDRLFARGGVKMRLLIRWIICDIILYLPHMRGRQCDFMSSWSFLWEIWRRSGITRIKVNLGQKNRLNCIGRSCLLTFITLRLIGMMKHYQVNIWLILYYKKICKNRFCVSCNCCIYIAPMHQCNREIFGSWIFANSWKWPKNCKNQASAMISCHVAYRL